MRKNKPERLALTMFLILSTLVVVLFGAGHAWSKETQISIQRTDVSQYPLVSLMITTADGAETNQPTLGKEHFSLQENGKPISHFRVKPILQEPEPLAVVLVMDVSTSMKGKPLLDAKAAAQTFLQSMKPEDQIAIVAFDSRSRIVSNLTSDKDTLLSAVKKLSGKGETALHDAVMSGLEILSQTSGGNKNLIVISDGKDTASVTSLEVILDEAREANVPIFGVGLQSPEFDPASLQSICKSSGGELLLTPDSSTLNDLFSHFARYLHNQYQIIYESKPSAATKLKLEVKMDAFGASARAQTALPNPKPLTKREGGKSHQAIA